MTIYKVITNIKDEVVKQSEVITDENGKTRKVIDPLVVIEIINEQLQEVEE